MDIKVGYDTILKIKRASPFLKCCRGRLERVHVGYYSLCTGCYSRYVEIYIHCVDIYTLCVGCYTRFSTVLAAMWAATGAV